MPIYKTQADSLEHQIRGGLFSPGARLPSIRGFSRSQGVSISTSIRTFQELERRGIIQSLPRSGYFVLASAEQADLPDAGSSCEQPLFTDCGQHLQPMLTAIQSPSVMDFATARPAEDLLPHQELKRASNEVWKTQRIQAFTDSFPPGMPALRKQVAKRMVRAGCAVSSENVLITHGCQSAMALALQLSTQPGDVVAVESPTHYSILELIDRLGLKALPIPTDPGYGISMNALEFACQQWPVKAFIVVPNFSNPMGYCMYDICKQRIVEVAKRHDVAVIEDGVYDALRINGKSPVPIKRLDTDERVYYCGSLSKTCGSGFKTGWLTVPEHKMQQALAMQYAQSSTVDTHAQLVNANLLEHGLIDRFLNHISIEYARRTSRMSASIKDCFPEGTRISRPSGGYLLWVQLPESVDTSQMLPGAVEQGAAYAPGVLFSPDGQFKNCLRLNASAFGSTATEHVLARLGGIFKHQVPSD